MKLTHLPCLDIQLLSEVPEACLPLATAMTAAWPEWYGAGGPGNALDDLASFARRDGLPLALVAHWEGELCGMLALKSAPWPGYQGQGPWVSAGLVLPHFRRRGVALAMLRAMEEVALEQRHPVLWSATSSAGGVLERAGWEYEETLEHADGPLRLYRRRVLHPAQTGDASQGIKGRVDESVT